MTKIRPQAVRRGAATDILDIRCLRLVCLLLLGSSFRTAEAAELWEQPWIEVSSEHFVIASALSEQATVELATALEHYRRAVDLLTGVTSTRDPIPTTIHVLARAERALGFEENLGGYFVPGMRANYAVMVSYGEVNDEILKHEYTHYLSRNRDQRRYPPWLEEGLADVLSTLSVTDGALEYGRVVGGRARTLVGGPWLPYRRVLEHEFGARRTRDVARFYAQSWLLVHYLMIGRRDHDFARETANFLRGLEARQSALEAFEASYGLAVDSLAAELTQYVRRIGYWRVELATPFPVPNLVTRSIPLDEIAADLGLLALRMGNYNAARPYYEAALRANPDNATALVGMADVNSWMGRFEVAVQLYERAIALEPDEDEHHLDYGEFFLGRANLERNEALRRELLVEARRRFARAYQLDPENPETLEQNGVTYLFDGEDAAKGVESLEQAYVLLPSQPDIQISLAAAYATSGDTAAARALLEPMLAVSHHLDVERIEKMLAEMGPPTDGADGPPAALEAAETD